MVDIIIPLGRKTRWEDNELRYALRSIEKYLTGYRDIYIVGMKRDWLTGVKYLQAEDAISTEVKQRCIYKKILTAAKHPEVSERFLKYHDDHFLLKPLHVDEIKNWYYGDLKMLAKKAEGIYNRVVLNSDKYLKDKGWTNFNFDIHVPIVLEKSKYLELENEDWSREHILKSLYCNKFGVEKEEMQDVKFGRPFRRQEIEAVIEGRMFFSMSENGLNGAIKEVLKELYPEPSRYEVKVINDIKITEVSVLPGGNYGIGYQNKI